MRDGLQHEVLFIAGGIDYRVEADFFLCVVHFFAVAPAEVVFNCFL
jgi:hypothetical protein